MASTDGKSLALSFKPGLFRQSTRYSATGAWFDSDKIRFRDGRPENMRGFQIRIPTAFNGTARAILVWQDLQANQDIAWGTETLLYLTAGGSIGEITPARLTSVESSVMNVSAGSPLVILSITSHGVSPNTFINVVSMTGTIGGTVYLHGLYQTVTVVDGNSFIISATQSATATSAHTGIANIEFLLSAGASSAYYAQGYGTGPYGGGGYGTSTTPGAITQNRQWTLDNWGEDLVANARGKQIAIWHASLGTTQRAQFIASSPSQSNYVVVSPEDRHMISLGGTDIVTSIYDPLLIQWSDTEDYNTWFPTVSNTAGSQRMGVGNAIMGGVRGRNQINVWTDQTLHAMTFVGPPFTFSFRQIGSNCGLIGPHAALQYGGVVYWMSNHNFFRDDGNLADMNCQVQKYVFDNINFQQFDKIYAGSNTEFNEIIWLYPSKNSNEIDSYVLYDILDNAWSIGTFNWTTWADIGTLPNVVATNGADEKLYDVDVSGIYTSNGSPMTSYVSSGQFDLQDGTQIMFIDRIIPDFDFVGGDNIAQIDMNTLQYPGSTPVVKGPYTASADSTYIALRARGRQAAIRVGVSEGNSGWRLGTLRFNVQADGAR